MSAIAISFASYYETAALCLLAEDIKQVRRDHLLATMKAKTKAEAIAATDLCLRELQAIRFKLFRDFEQGETCDHP